MCVYHTWLLSGNINGYKIANTQLFCISASTGTSGSALLVPQYVVCHLLDEVQKLILYYIHLHFHCIRMIKSSDFAESLRRYCIFAELLDVAMIF